MRYMMIVKGNDDSGCMPPQALMQALHESGEELTRAGIMVGSGGLLPTATGAKIRLGDGEVRVIDGPFSEAKELIGGYAIMEVGSKEEAIRLGRDFMQMHLDILGPSYQGELEIRQMMDSPPARCAGDAAAGTGRRPLPVIPGAPAAATPGSASWPPPPRRPSPPAGRPARGGTRR
jgi:hypothetical protein